MNYSNKTIQEGDRFFFTLLNTGRTTHMNGIIECKNETINVVKPNEEDLIIPLFQDTRQELIINLSE